MPVEATLAATRIVLVASRSSAAVSTARSASSLANDRAALTSSG